MTPGWGRFAALWAPQTLALTGRGLTMFALGVWVYEKTHSATYFSLLSLSTMLPGVLAAPHRRPAPSRLAGYIVASYLPGGLVLVLATPLVLSLAGPEALGAV
ncbi:MAG TPA: hypothetical protein VK841_23250, partial [Polyangiaceae bacterium]|nr:hypothetical protein [Polyangiaceae bacterium]